ncbi:MAG: hypothetical protein OXH42_04145 [Acidimicrobiaceae bacterium]|nr:hypothetical protein [Acidimicrobiaceae bacterium]MDE0676511.1 hypothetical protein [Acidimicrobiaceae bacterium]
MGSGTRSASDASIWQPIRVLASTRLGLMLRHKSVRRLLALVQTLLLAYFVGMAYLFLWLGGSVARFESHTRYWAWNAAFVVLFAAGVCVLVSGIVVFMLESAGQSRVRHWMLMICAVGYLGVALLLFTSFGLSLSADLSGETAAATIAWYAVALCLVLPTGVSALVQMVVARDGTKLSSGRSACDS